jgi:hypothetical protein
MDFTGGNRDLNQPIIQYYNNVFVGASDDMLDLDGTDAWIEGNIFLHGHKNGSPDSSSAISGGDDSGNTSEVTIIGNLFFDCDQAATAKQGNFFTLLNNTIVRTTRSGGLDTAAGVVNVRDFPDGGQPTAFGKGFYLEGNIIVDAEQLVRNYDSQQTSVTFNNNILPFAWSGPGNGNSVVDPLLKHIPQLSETFFTTWEEAQVMRDWFSLLPGSPALRTGPNGRDIGGVVPLGAYLTGEPTGTNNQTTATLTVGINRNGSGIPTAGFPEGSGYSHYKWRLDGGAWSAETPIATPIALIGLGNGPHRVEVVGKRDSGWYQDDPAFGPEAVITASRTWLVDTNSLPPAGSGLVINEILAKNDSAVPHGASYPDLIELFNNGESALDLSGLGLTDDANTKYKFTFPIGTMLAPGGFLLIYADSSSGASELHPQVGIVERGLTQALGAAYHLVGEAHCGLHHCLREWRRAAAFLAKEVGLDRSELQPRLLARRVHDFERAAAQPGCIAGHSEERQPVIANRTRAARQHHDHVGGMPVEHEALDAVEPEFAFGDRRSGFDARRVPATVRLGEGQRRHRVTRGDWRQQFALLRFSAGVHDGARSQHGRGEVRRTE